MNFGFSRVLAAIRNGLTTNAGLKAFSLGTAVLLFAYVRGSSDAQRFVYVDVVALQPTSESDVVLLSQIPDRVRLTLLGSSSRLNSLRREDLESVQIQLDPARRNYYFEPNDFDVPAGVYVEQIAPASFPLVWAPLVEKTLPLRVKVSQRPEEGLQVVGHPVAEPVSIKVRGPEEEVDSMPSVTTEEVDLARFTVGKHHVRVRLEEPPQHVSYDWNGPVSVRLEVGPELGERRFAGLTISPVGVEGAIELRPKRVQVVLRGPPEVIDGLDAEGIVPWVDARKVEEGTVALPVSVRGLPQGVELVRVEPTEVLVTERGKSGRKKKP